MNYYSGLKLFLMLIIANCISAQDTTYLIFDEPCQNSLPVHFRMSGDPMRLSTEVMPDTNGLENLKASGSAEFCYLNLPFMMEKINYSKITILDLRQESHGFVNGLCVSWYGKYDWGNVGLSQQEILTDEKHRLDSLQNLKNISVTQIIKKDKATNEITESEQLPLDVKTVQNEEELTKQFNLGYFRITATDHRKPVTEDVDRFIEFVNSLENDTWLHFHCHAGDGRTTTFLAMYDMMRNAKKVSLNDILGRQFLLGGIDLIKDDDYPDFDKKYAIERTKFLGDFYDYCKGNSDNFKTPYSDWISKK
jgi:protein-tyrosine phosphatase